MKRGKKSIAIDLKQSEGKDVFKALCKRADVLIEPFRPGVMEKLGLGPKVLTEGNKRLIYTRLSGFGQTGPMSKAAGHDINYLAISGVLNTLGTADPQNPHPPVNILADYAGGGLSGAFGIVTALFEREKSGLGQVIDANLVEGTAYVSTGIFATRDPSITTIASVMWPNLKERGKNLLDGGTHFYRVYRTKDNKHMAVGSLEPQFFAKLCEGLKIDENDYSQYDIENWDKYSQRIQEIFMTKTQDEWSSIFDPMESCVTPVLATESAKDYPHNKVRGSFMSSGLPRPAPLLDRTPGQPDQTEPRFAEHTEEILLSLGYTKSQLESLVSKNAIAVDEEAALKSKL